MLEHLTENMYHHSEPTHDSDEDNHPIDRIHIMFSRIQRDVAARIAVTWIDANKRIVSDARIGPLHVLKTVLLDERLWPIVAYRYRTTIVLGILCKGLLILLRIVMGIKLGGEIGPGFSIGHANSIFLNNNVVIGTDVRLNQETTIAGGRPGYPHIGDNVHVAAGAKILGNIRIGNNVHVGANAVVLDDVPSDSTVAGIPAKLVKLCGQRVDITLKDYWNNHA